MPQISSFYGIVIKMYFQHSEHNPPHFHAVYGEYIGAFDLETLEMIEGDLPAKASQIFDLLTEFFFQKNSRNSFIVSHGCRACVATRCVASEFRSAKLTNSFLAKLAACVEATAK